MRILMLNYEFPPLGGGAANATYYLLKEFSKFPDIHIDLVTSSVDKFRIEKFSDNITIHFLNVWKHRDLHFQEKRNLLFYSLKAFFYSRKLIKKEKYQLIHAFFGIPCGYIAMRLGLPYIVSLRGSDVPFYNERFELLDKYLFERISKKIWKRAKAVVTNSEDLKNLALQTSPGYPISVIYNGVDTDFFNPNETHQPHNGQIKIISTGRLIERKGYKYLIEALNGIKNVKLDLIGGGPLKEELKALAKKLGIDVTFWKRQEKETIKKMLQNADLFVLPSLNEGMSNSILEAMACGLPIIATDSGTKELIQGNGYIVNKATSGEIRECVLEILDNKDLLEKFGIQSRRNAECMRWGNSAGKYIEIFKNICN